MARKPLYTTIDLSGPFFKSSPSKTFRQNARSMMRAVAIEGQVDAIAGLIPGEHGRAPISSGVTPDRVSRHVAASVPYTPGHAKTGRIFANVYVPNFGMSQRQGKALMAAYSRVESQTHAFRRTSARLRRAKAVNVAELLKGLV